MHLFFFGSLTDRELLELVLGRDCAAIDFRPARLPGFATNRVKFESYPVLVPKPASIVTGQLVGVLTEADIARVNAVLDFPGRIEREEWVAQARMMMNR